MATTPLDVHTSEGLRDIHGRRQFVVKTVGQALVAGDIKEAGSITDADGREHVILLDGSGNPITGGGGGSGTSLGGIYDVCNPPSGLGITPAVGDGITNDAAAINSAISYAKANGGTVYLDPRKTFLLGLTPLDCTIGSKAFRVTGMGQGPGHINIGNPVLLWTGGAGSGPIVKVYSPAGFELDHLHIVYDNPAYDGHMVDVDGALSNDATNWHLHHLSFRGKLSGLHYQSAKSNIRLSKAIGGKISEVMFADAVNPLRVGDPGGTYVNTTEVDGCQFTDGADSMVLLGTADLEAFKFSNCFFEAGNNTTAIRGSTVATDGGQHQIYNLSIEGCWFGDASGNTTWIKDLLTVGASPIVIFNNFFGDCGLSGYHVGGSGNYFIVANRFTGGAGVFHSTTGATVNFIANFFNQNTLLVHNPQSSDQISLTGNTDAHGGSYPQAVGNTPYDRFGKGRLALGGSANPAQIDPASGLTNEDLVFATFANAATPVAPLDKGFIMVGKNPNPTGERAMILQAPWTGSTGWLELWAGSGPFQVMRIQGAASQVNCKLGFYAATPVVQAARVGQLTDSTGGSVSSTLAAGITDTVAKNAIASLAAKVNALETVLHNLGLTA